MNDVDIFKVIAENLSERKSTAALNNYQVLCNNIDYVNKTFEFELLYLKAMQKEISVNLKNDSLLNADFLDPTKSEFYFRNILPRILLNDINIYEKFLLNTMPDNRRNIKLENVSELRRSFIDYSDLVTAARQYIDSLISDVYQLLVLDAKSLNYHVLLSLNSFNKYATKSIKEGLFNTDINNILGEFEKLSYKQWKSSPITQCMHPTFAEKVDFIFTQLNIIGEDVLKEEIKNLFKFSSEFAHIGYISTFFSSTYEKEIIFADDIGPYLPSTENYSELKYQILETAMKFFYIVYIPTLVYCYNKVFKNSFSNDLEINLKERIKDVSGRLQTRNNKYYFFIVNGLIESEDTIPLKCMCGTTRIWEAPHNMNKLFCENCGSVFRLLAVDKGAGYILTSEGPTKPIGADLPEFHELPYEKQVKILKQCEKIGKKANE